MRAACARTEKKSADYEKSNKRGPKKHFVAMVLLFMATILNAAAPAVAKTQKITDYIYILPLCPAYFHPQIS
jgi:hypothetical protein